MMAFKRKYKSRRNSLLLTACSRFLLVAAMTRTSTLKDSVPPTRMTSEVSSTRKSFTWVFKGISPISSRNMVPLSAASKYPFFCPMAPVKEPFSWPNNSDSRIPSGIAPQLTLMSGFPLRLLKR